MTRLCANVVVIGIGIFLLGSSTAEAQPQLPTEQDVQGALAACSIPRSREVEANLIGAINLWKNEKISGRANIRFTSFLDSFSDENVKLKAYEIYIGCPKVFLDKFSEGG